VSACNEVLDFLNELVISDEVIQREAEKERKQIDLAMVRTRRVRGLRQAEVAQRLGVSRALVSKLEDPDGAVIRVDRRLFSSGRDRA